MSWILAAEGGHHTFGGPFAAPTLTELFEFPALFGDGTLFRFDRIILIMLFMTLAAAAFMTFGLGPAKVVPGKLQAAAEAIVGFVRDQIIHPVMGKDGLPFLPLLLTIFLFVWFNNLAGILPFVNFPPTSRMAFPALLSVLIYVTFIVTGLVKQGPRYLLEVAFPPGVPKALYILVTPIELVSTFLVRPLTLAVRLFANMMAGHILLTIIFLAAYSFLGSSLAGFPVGVISLAGAVLFTGFELLVGFLQAYIMTILAAVYIGGALHPEH